MIYPGTIQLKNLEVVVVPTSSAISVIGFRELFFSEFIIKKSKSEYLYSFCHTLVSDFEL
ncbi:hypothetical protein LCGC14_0657190 [marine sediment metagenome]|uniref:Uncharacterized protein n=1 Tax=marine sediment metagenome TaxID=412755 RepID=A0A0F9QZN7_9ZZZZ